MSQLKRVQQRAHQAVGRAIKRGDLTRQACEVCGASEMVHGHHDDYGRPLDVRWLCAVHHRKFHAEIQRRLRVNYSDQPPPTASQAVLFFSQGNFFAEDVPIRRADGEPGSLLEQLAIIHGCEFGNPAIALPTAVFDVHN